jgi:ABC-type Na+ transport system ATPase subunit NatA
VLRRDDAAPSSTSSPTSAARGRAKERIDHVIARLHLDKVLHRRSTRCPRDSSAAWAGTAILHDPEVLVLDEPTDGLDQIRSTKCAR